MNFSKFFSPLLFPTSTILPNISINVEKKKFIKLDQTSSNRFPLSLFLSFSFRTKLLVRDACEGVTKEEKEEEEDK